MNTFILVIVAILFGIVLLALLAPIITVAGMLTALLGLLTGNGALAGCGVLHGCSVPRYGSTWTQSLYTRSIEQLLITSLDKKERISRPGYLPIGYEVHHPELPIDTYIAPKPEKESFIPGGYHNGTAKLSRSKPKSSQRDRHIRAGTQKTSGWTLGRVAFWLVMTLVATPFVLWWLIVKVARPDEK